MSTHNINSFEVIWPNNSNRMKCIRAVGSTSIKRKAWSSWILLYRMSPKMTSSRISSQMMINRAGIRKSSIRRRRPNLETKSMPKTIESTRKRLMKSCSKDWNHFKMKIIDLKKKNTANGAKDHLIMSNAKKKSVIQKWKNKGILLTLTKTPAKHQLISWNSKSPT